MRERFHDGDQDVLSHVLRYTATNRRCLSELLSASQRWNSGDREGKKAFGARLALDEWSLDLFRHVHRDGSRAAGQYAHR